MANKMLKNRGVRILMFAGVIKVVVDLFITQVSVSSDYIISAGLLLLFIMFLSYQIFIRKPRISLASLFVVGYIVMVAFNYLLGIFDLIIPLSTAELLMSGVDLGLLSIGVGYVRGVKK